jgi:hypothetical protein
VRVHLKIHAKKQIGIFENMAKDFSKALAK